ncbi:hypothetical protein YC2023_046091 [Brassica napus]
MHVQFKLFDLSLFDLYTLALSVSGYLQSTEDKCICIVSHAPNFRALWDSLEVIFGLYFSSEGSCKPLWYIIAMFSVSIFPLYLIAKLVNEGEVTKAETMTIGEIFDYIKKGSAKEVFSFVYNCYQSCLFLPTSDSPTGETTFAATAELPLLSGNVLSASSKGCGDLADERMVAQITVAKHRKPNVLPMSNRSFQFLSFHAPFDLTKKKVMNVILDPIEDSTESQAEKTYSLLAFDGLQSSFAGQKSSVGLINLTFIGDESWPHLQQY